MEPIVFVNKDGTPTGEHGPKLGSHHRNTRLHLAFSCYVFNQKGELLVTQRAFSKKVWPGFWTNSVCGHPLPNEALVDAIKRRLDFELGMAAEDFQVALPEYRYRTPPYHGIIENEFCPVFFARATSEPNPNPEEVADFTWVKWRDFISKAAEDHNDYSMYAKKGGVKNDAPSPVYSWWCKDQLKRLKDLALVRDYITPISS